MGADVETETLCCMAVYKCVYVVMFNVQKMKPYGRQRLTVRVTRGEEKTESEKEIVGGTIFVGGHSVPFNVF